MFVPEERPVQRDKTGHNENVPQGRHSQVPRWNRGPKERVSALKRAFSKYTMSSHVQMFLIID